IHADRRQGLRRFPVGDGFADLNFLDAGDGHHVAGLGGVDLDAFQPLPAVQLRDLTGDLRAVGAAQRIQTGGAEFAADATADRQPADVVVIVEVVDLKLYGRRPVAA